MHLASIAALSLAFTFLGADQRKSFNEADVTISLGGTCDKNDDNCQELTFNVDSLQDFKQNAAKDIEKTILRMLGTESLTTDITTTTPNVQTPQVETTTYEEPSPTTTNHENPTSDEPDDVQFLKTTGLDRTTNEQTTTTEVTESFTTSGCPQSELQFPNKMQTKDYVIINESFPDMTEATVCAWLTPSTEESLYGKMFSYASSNDFHNAFLIEFEQQSLKVYVNNEEFIFRVIAEKNPLNFCIVVSTTSCSAKVELAQKDSTGHSRYETQNRSGIDRIGGKGILVLGQDQDDLLRGFESKDAFIGTIENLRLWNRTLDKDEIAEILKDKCYCPDGVIAYPKQTDKRNGGVIGNFTNTC